MEEGILKGITELTEIYKDGENARYTLDGTHFEGLSGDRVVSMNLWGFRKKFWTSCGPDFPGSWMKICR